MMSNMWCQRNPLPLSQLRYSIAQHCIVTRTKTTRESKRHSKEGLASVRAVEMMESRGEGEYSQRGDDEGRVSREVA